MNKQTLLHPQVTAALARAGHGSRVLIADGNYPFSTANGKNAEVVYLNISPGLPTVQDLLVPILETIVVERAAVMALPDGSRAQLSYQFSDTLGDSVPLDVIERFDFYEQARSDDVALVIATADQGICANLLLTIGVRQ